MLQGTTQVTDLRLGFVMIYTFPIYQIPIQKVIATAHGHIKIT